MHRAHARAGWPRYESPKSGLHLYRHVPSQRWVLNAQFDPEQKEEELLGAGDATTFQPVHIRATDGPVPMGRQIWTRQGMDVEISVTELAAESDAAAHMAAVTGEKEAAEAGALESAPTQLRDPSESVVLTAVKNIRVILSRPDNPPIDTVLETGVLPRLVELMSATNAQLQFEAAWAITNSKSHTLGTTLAQPSQV